MKPINLADDSHVPPPPEMAVHLAKLAITAKADGTVPKVGVLP